MQPIQITPIEKNITIHFDGQKITLPTEIEAKVNTYWQELTRANPKLHNGEAFTVTEVQETPDGLDIQLAETNYAHYLYSHNIGDLGEYAVRVIHSGALIITADNKLVFGAMGKHTSRPGIIQCSGGGIDYGDITDNVIDIEHSTAKELSEEVGLDLYNTKQVTSFAAAYLKSGGPTNKMTVSYIVHIKQTGIAFLQTYETFAKNLIETGEDPEFDKLFCIDMDRETVDAFIAEHADKFDEYMPILLQTIANELQILG